MHPTMLVVLPMLWCDRTPNGYLVHQYATNSTSVQGGTPSSFFAPRQQKCRQKSLFPNCTLRAEMNSAFKFRMVATKLKSTITGLHFDIRIQIPRVSIKYNLTARDARDYRKRSDSSVLWCGSWFLYSLDSCGSSLESLPNLILTIVGVAKSMFGQQTSNIFSPFFLEHIHSSQGVKLC